MAVNQIYAQASNKANPLTCLLSYSGIFHLQSELQRIYGKGATQKKRCREGRHLPMDLQQKLKSKSRRCHTACSTLACSRGGG